MTSFEWYFVKLYFTITTNIRLVLKFSISIELLSFGCKLQVKKVLQHCTLIKGPRGFPKNIFINILTQKWKTTWWKEIGVFRKVLQTFYWNASCGSKVSKAFYLRSQDRGLESSQRWSQGANSKGKVFAKL